MNELSRMTFPHPVALPRHRRRRYWMELGEPHAFGQMVLTLQRDTRDGVHERPHFLAECAGQTGRVPYDRCMWVPGLPGVSLIPRAVRVRAGCRVAVLLELRAEHESVSLGRAA